MSKSIRNTFKKPINDSIDAFTSELKARIDLLNSSQFSSNVDNNKNAFSKIEKIMRVYTDNPVEKMELEDLYNVSLIDIKNLLKLIGSSDEYIDELIESIKSNPTGISIYQEVYFKIRDYIEHFITINNSQNEMLTKMKADYQKYLDLFSNGKIKEPFDNIDELINVMSSINLPDADKAEILKYIAIKNNEKVDELGYDINLVSKCNDIINTYLPEESSNSYKVISKYIKANEIDIDLIPSIALDLSSLTELSLNDTQNALVSIILNFLVDNYIKEPTEETEKELNYILRFVISIGEEIIASAKQVINLNSEFYNNSINAGYDDFEQYGNKTISELETIYNSRDLAIDLKKLPVIKIISDTLDTLEKQSVDSEKYNLCCSSLVELMDTIELIENKRKSV